MNNRSVPVTMGKSLLGVKGKKRKNKFGKVLLAIYLL